MASAVLNTPAPKPFEEIDWEFLFKLAEMHNVIMMISPAISKIELTESAKKLFDITYNFYLARITRQNIEAERVFSAFEAKGIRYIKMKGSHISEFYPYDFMRSYGDIDILIDEGNLESSKPLMECLGYALNNTTDFHDEYEKDEFFIYEIHSNLVSKKEKYASVFSEPFSKAVASQDNKFCYKLKSEYLYLHLFFHLYRHFITTGCGIRLFADLLVFDKYVKDADQGFIKSVLKKYKMLDFHETVEKLMQYFFFGSDECDEVEEIAEYILQSYTTGFFKHYVASLGFWGKVKYFLKNWFPSAKDLAFRYPVLNKAPILLPLCWLRRIFYSLFFNRSAFKTQANSIKEVNSQQYKNINKVRKMAEKPN